MDKSQNVRGDVRSVTAPDGVEIIYEVVGQGPPIVLLHGSFVGRRTFSRQRSALARQFRLILISSRGHDGTDTTLPPDFGFFTTEVEDVCLVMNAENAGRAGIIAHSTGGATAVALARRCPERVERMVLIEPTLHPLLPPAIYQQVSRLFLGIAEASRAPDASAAWRVFMGAAAGAQWLELDDAKKDQIIDALLPLSPLLRPHAEQLLNFPIAEEDILALTAPALLFYGSDSIFFEPSLSARLADLRPDFRQVHVEVSGHNVHHDQPDIVNAEILNFFSANYEPPVPGQR